VAKLTLNDIESGYASVAAFNANFAAIETAIENTLSRDGTTPNQMEADIDMNDYSLLNVGGLVVNGVDITDFVNGAAEAAASAAAALLSEQNAAASEAVVVATAGDLTGLEYRGAWATATAYEVNNIVYVASEGSSYICLVDHTSDTFATELAADKWGYLAAKGAAGAGTGDMLKAENLSGLANYTIARSNLGLAIGTNVQAYDAELAAIAGLTSAANKIPMFSGSGTASLIDFKDEDNMASNSATAAPSQQSVKAYVDTSVAAVSSLSAKAWCVFNGLLTGTNAPTAGSNVTSVTRNSMGNYTVTLTTALGSTNHAVMTSSPPHSLPDYDYHIGATVASTTTITVVTKSGGYSYDLRDISKVYLVVF
jgi:hypothetical protein